MSSDAQFPDTLREHQAWLANLKVGDPVLRMLGGLIEVHLQVTQVLEDRLVCGLWEFDRFNGAEIDEDLDFGPGIVVSFIRNPNR